MSYILEALRKAERERNAGKAPDLQVAARSEPRLPQLPSARRWLTLAAAIFTGLCIGIALWLRPSHEPKPVAASAATAPAAETAPIAESPSAAPLEEAAPGAARLDDLLDKTSPDALPIEEQKKLSTALAPHPAVIKPIEPEAAPDPDPAPVDHPTLAEQATSEPELPPELKTLKEMPADYRSNFPTIRVDVHAYDEQPAKRFVMINGRRYREGEVLVEGPAIVSIEEDGIVFNYRNEEVLYPIAR